MAVSQAWPLESSTASFHCILVAEWPESPDSREGNLSIEEMLKSPQTFLLLFVCFFNIYLFIYLAVLGLSCHVRALSCGMQDLVPRPGIEPGPPALRAQSINRWTTREVPIDVFLNCHNMQSQSLLRFDFPMSLLYIWKGMGVTETSLLSTSSDL